MFLLTSYMTLDTKPIFFVQVHFSISWRTLPILACPSLKMASPSFTEMRNFQ